ncbi:MAG: hypothetical protein JWQ38_2678 [Flavipsychrobacter sp.]|nr:hypothetical protein [Flavipsychrobacter sp.]
MKRSIFLLLLVVVACGGAVFAAAKAKVYLKFLTTTTERVEPTTPDGRAKTIQHFIIVWQNIDCPATFFWRGDNGWTPCRIEKVHNTGTKKVPVYEVKLVNNDNDMIHCGDTLQLTPTPGGKFRIPAEIPPSAKNTLYFKTGGSNWLAFPVKGMGKK